jgi:hypothetical protein
MSSISTNVVKYMQTDFTGYFPISEELVSVTLAFERHKL